MTSVIMEIQTMTGRQSGTPVHGLQSPACAGLTPSTMATALALKTLSNKQTKITVRLVSDHSHSPELSKSVPIPALQSFQQLRCIPLHTPLPLPVSLPVDVQAATSLLEVPPPAACEQAGGPAVPLGSFFCCRLPALG